MQGYECVVKLNNVPFALADDTAHAAFESWIQEGARKSAFEPVAELAAAAADLEVVLELQGQQHSNRSIG